MVAAVMVAVVAGGAVLLALGRADSQPKAAPPPTLAPSAVPYLDSKVTDIGVPELAKDANLSALPSTLSKLGFVVGAERTFQGPERHRLQLVISRTLRFQTAAGAHAFVRFVDTHAGDYVGQIPTVKPMRSAGRTGAMIVAPLCACHLAQPTLLATVSSGRDVTWLEINGSSATPALLAKLVRQAP